MAEKGYRPPYAPKPAAQTQGFHSPIYSTGFTQASPLGYSSAPPHGHHGNENDQWRRQYATSQGQGQFVNSNMTNNVMVTQGGGATGPIYQMAPHDYTTQAWLAFLCCFWPTGLVAILKASAARDALARGDLNGAQSASNQARTMVRISYVVGIISTVAAVVTIGVYYGLAFSSI